MGAEIVKCSAVSVWPNEIAHAMVHGIVREMPKFRSVFHLPCLDIFGKLPRQVDKVVQQNAVQSRFVQL